MICYCSNCKINWARLHTVESDGEEQYEVCPVCRSDMFLEDGNDIVSYICCPITGNVLNTETKEPFIEQSKYIKPKIRIKVGMPVKKKLTREEWEDLELKAILAYQESGNKEDYFKTFKQ